MAQLNDTMVQGDLRVTGTAYGSFNGSFTGNLNGAATKLGSGNIGSGSKPIYLAAGVATECSSYGGGSLVSLNGSLYSGTTATFYAPSSAGTLGNVLVSNGNGAPSWNSAAPLAYALANSSGSGASAKAVAGNLDGFAVTYGTSGTNGYLSSNLGPGVLTISNRVSSSTTNTTTIASNSASFGGTLTVSGGASCNGGLGVKTGLTMLNNSNTAVATIANTGDIATSGTVTATGYMSTSGTLTAAGSITSRSGIACENGPIYVADTTVSPAAVKAQIKANGDIELSGMLIGDIQDFGNSSRHMRIGWGGTAIQQIVTSRNNPSSLSESAYLVGIYIANNVVYYKDVHASNVTVGNADACGGYKVVVGSFGSTAGTLYFA